MTAMAAVLLSAVGFASCASETVTPEAQPSDIVTRSVVFNIQLPGGDPVHFTRTAVQEGNEYACNTLTILVYDAASNALLDKVDMTTGTGAVGSAIASGNNYTYEYTMTPAAGTLARRFVVVANDLLTNVDVNETWSDLQAETVTTELAADANLSTVFANGYLPMSGIAHLGSADGTTVIPMDGTSQVNVNVTLTRCVARIDVANNVPNLEITGLKLINANPKGYLMPHGTTNSVAIPASMTRVGGLQPANPIANITAASDGAESNGHFIPAVANTPAVLKKAFYVYEDAIQDPSSTPLTMLVQGTLGGSIPVYYTIPFTNANLTTPVDDGKSLEIERNHRYLLTLGNGSAININTNLSSTLSFADWTTESVGGTFNATIFSGATTSPDTYTAGTQTFSVAATTTAVGTVTVADGYYNSGAGVTMQDVQVITTAADWVGSEGTPKASSDDWLTATVTDAQTITITATENTAATARTGSVRVQYQNSTSDTTPRYIVFSVTQAAAAANP